MALQDVQNRIDVACRQADRSPSEVTLIAVSKTFPSDTIRPILTSGHSVFGENKVQETAQKWPALRDEFLKTQLHLIGPLQTNKVRAAFDLFDCIHTLDRPKLAGKLADLAQEKAQCPDIFIQVNIGEEPQKSGIAVTDLANFVKDCRETYALPVCGLMAIPPQHEAPENHFKILKALANDNGLSNLSMGMSADFEQAIHHGATHIRVGSAIFGAR